MILFFLHSHYILFSSYLYPHLLLELYLLPRSIFSATCFSATWLFLICHVTISFILFFQAMYISLIQQSIAVPFLWFIRDFTAVFCYKITSISGNSIFIFSSAAVFQYPSFDSFEPYFGGATNFSFGSSLITYSLSAETILFLAIDHTYVIGIP